MSGRPAHAAPAAGRCWLIRAASKQPRGCTQPPPHACAPRQCGAGGASGPLTPPQRWNRVALARPGAGQRRRPQLTVTATNRQVEDWEPMPPPSAPPSRALQPMAARTVSAPPPRRGLSKNQKTAAAAIALAAALLLYVTRDSLTPVRNTLLSRLEGPFITEFPDGDVMLRSPLGTTYYSRDSDGNLLSLQDNGDLYVERLDAEGRLDTAYLVGNIRDVPDVRADVLADRVEEELARGGQ